MPNKVCPLVFRSRKKVIEILSFKHPTERKQIVKGTIDSGEIPAQAAVRELAEESGLVSSDTHEYIGNTKLPDLNNWYFFVCKVNGVLPDQWDFETLDDGGHTFSFFWQDLNTDLDEEWHPLFHSVFAFLRPVIQERISEVEQLLSG